MQRVAAAVRAFTSWPGRRVSFAVLALIVASAWCFNNVVLAPERARAEEALALALRIRADDAPLRAWLREMNNPSPRPAEAVTAARSELLKNLNLIAQQTKTHLVRVTPPLDGSGPIELEAEAPFPNLVQLIGQLEARGGVLHRLQIRPQRSDNSPAPTTLATFVLDWADSSSDPVPPAIAERLTAAAAVADPFRPFGDRTNDSLRSGHFLSGITKTNDDLFATIDGQDYRLGDPFGTGSITAIQDDAVQLSSGTVQSWLHLGVR